MGRKKLTIFSTTLTNFLAPETHPERKEPPCIFSIIYRRFSRNAARSDSEFALRRMGTDSDTNEGQNGANLPLRAERERKENSLLKENLTSIANGNLRRNSGR